MWKAEDALSVCFAETSVDGMRVLRPSEIPVCLIVVVCVPSRALHVLNGKPKRRQQVCTMWSTSTTPLSTFTRSRRSTGRPTKGFHTRDGRFVDTIKECLKASPGPWSVHARGRAAQASRDGVRSVDRRQGMERSRGPRPRPPPPPPPPKSLTRWIRRWQEERPRPQVVALDNPSHCCTPCPSSLRPRSVME